MLLGIAEALPSLVAAKFKAAKASQSLLFSTTELAIIHTSAGTPFQLRYCPALAKKPEPRKIDTPPAKKPDPFDNPSPDLLITEVPTTNPSHILVLNKYPVIAEHFILATRKNKQQTHVLEQDDLEITYACLKAWQGNETHSKGNRLFAFFNSGDNSGASQSHRHLQFLPVETMKENQEGNSWELLVDQILSSPTARGMQKKQDLVTSIDVLKHPDLPFTHFGLRFSSDPTSAQLLQAYDDLYQLSKTAIDEFIASNPGEFALHPTDKGDLPISYNLAITTSGMVILPRRSEGTMLRREDGTDIGFIALNGTTLGGTLMVKYQEEWDVLRAQPKKLDSILEAIGIPQTK